MPELWQGPPTCVVQQYPADVARPPCQSDQQLLKGKVKIQICHCVGQVHVLISWNKIPHRLEMHRMQKPSPLPIKEKKGRKCGTLEISTLNFARNVGSLNNKAEKKTTVKRQADTKTQWSTSQISLFYSCSSRKYPYPLPSTEGNGNSGERGV